MRTLSLVIPAYEEQARIPALLTALARSAQPAASAAGMELGEILIVDDGSRDETREMLAAAGAEGGLVRPILDITENRGKGAAFAAGAAAAQSEYVLLADVDLSTPLEELPKLAAEIEGGADIAIGSRAIEGAVVERGPLHRRLSGKAFNGTVRALTGLAIKDTQCGFKLLSASNARALVARQLCPGFAFDVELLMRADAAGLRVVEVPVLYLHDERSRVRVVSAGVRMLKDVCSIAYRLRREERPRFVPPPLADLPRDDPE